MSVEVAAPPSVARPTRALRAYALAAGAVCHVSFAAAVGAMIAMMMYGMSRAFGRAPWPWAILADALLIAQFPAAHSLLLNRGGGARLARLAPAALGRTMTTTSYVIVASWQTAALFLLWTPTGVVWWRATGAGLAAMLGLYAFAWGYLGLAILNAGLGLQTGFTGWWAAFRGRRPVYPPMPTGGLFRLTRQPIYLGFALTLWTVPTWTPDQLALAVPLTLYCVLGPRFKEARFRARYGAAFDAYCARTPYFTPRPWRRRPPAG